MEQIRLLNLQDGMRNNNYTIKRTVDKKEYQYKLIDNEGILIMKGCDLVEFLDS